MEILLSVSLIFKSFIEFSFRGAVVVSYCTAVQEIAGSIPALPS